MRQRLIVDFFFVFLFQDSLLGMIHNRSSIGLVLLRGSSISLEECIVFIFPLLRASAQTLLRRSIAALVDCWL